MSFDTNFSVFTVVGKESFGRTKKFLRTGRQLFIVGVCVPVAKVKHLMFSQSGWPGNLCTSMWTELQLA